MTIAGNHEIRIRRRDLILLAAVTAFGPLSLDLYLPGLPNLRSDFGVSAATAQLTVTACICGLAVGQLLGGSISDAIGRRRPAMVATVSWTVTTVVCATAWSIGAILVLRLLQGLFAGVCIAVSRAMLADRDPDNLMLHLSRMLLVLAAVPVLAPWLGGLMIAVDGWRGLFLILAGAGACLAVVAIRRLPESLPAIERTPLQVRDSVRAYGVLIRTPRFILPALSCGACFGVLFSYISSSPFILRDHYGLSPAVYGLVFGSNAAGLIMGMQLSPRIASRIGVRRTELLATATGASAAVGLLVAASAGVALPGLLVLLFILLSATGIVIPAASAEAMNASKQATGAASGLTGALQFIVGGLVGAIGAILGLGNGMNELAIVVAACHLVALGLTWVNRLDEPAVIPAQLPVLGDQEAA